MFVPSHLWIGIYNTGHLVLFTGSYFAPDSNYTKKKENHPIKLCYLEQGMQRTWVDANV